MEPIKRRNVIKDYKFVKGESSLKEFKRIPVQSGTPSSVLKTSIYSEYIPLNYVLSTEWEIPFMSTGINKDDYKDFVFENTPLNNCFKHLLKNIRRENGKIDETRIKSDLKSFVNDYLKHDKIINFFNINNRYSLSSTWNIETQFLKSEFSNFRMRSFKGYVGNYNLFNENSPVVLPVIHRDSLMEVKYNFLLTGKIDTDFISLFIDKEIENTGYENKNFRAFYKKYIEKNILESKMNLCYVPKQFILENCFIQPLKLSNNLIQRKQQIQEKINEFINGIQPESELYDVEPF